MCHKTFDVSFKLLKSVKTNRSSRTVKNRWQAGVLLWSRFSSHGTTLVHGFLPRKEQKSWAVLSEKRFSWISWLTSLFFLFCPYFSFRITEIRRIEAAKIMKQMHPYLIVAMLTYKMFIFTSLITALVFSLKENFFSIIFCWNAIPHLPSIILTQNCCLNE